MEKRMGGLCIPIVVVIVGALLGYSENVFAQPSMPSGLVALGEDGQVTLYWTPNPEPNIWYYRIYISLSAQGPFSWNSSVFHPQTTFIKRGLFNGVTYYFKLSAVNTAGEESPLTAPVSATPQAPMANYELTAIPDDGKVRLQWDSVPGASEYYLYMSTDPSGPYTLLASLSWKELAYTVNSLYNHRKYYFRLYAAFNPIALEFHDKKFINEAMAVPSDRLGFAETASSYIVQYYVNGKPVRYHFHKLTAEDINGNYSQFAYHISFDNIPVTATPYAGGKGGLILITLANNGGFTDTPQFSAMLESFIPGQSLVLRYISTESKNNIPAGDAEVWMIFEAHKPYLKIRVWARPLIPLGNFRSSWNVFSAIGGSYNPNSRVVIPYDENSYYVINGQALGIHYFPRKDTWSLRMGAEGTPYEHITTGFFFTHSNEARLLTNPGWAMGHDYCEGLDSVPYGLDQIFDDLYINYQEDEAGGCMENGLGYSWQNADTALRSASPDAPYESEIYYWVGEDNWTGEYGLNQESQYRFAIDVWQDVAASNQSLMRSPRARFPRELTVAPSVSFQRYALKLTISNYQDIHSVRIQVFDLKGREIFDSGFVNDPLQEWKLGYVGQPIASGAYLVTVTVRTRNGDIRSFVRKLAVLR
ncbi:MAG: fibronectin type III domain-containing protein [Candidatus Methanomethylicaceae archaeon]